MHRFVGAGILRAWWSPVAPRSSHADPNWQHSRQATTPRRSPMGAGGMCFNGHKGPRGRNQRMCEALSLKCCLGVRCVRTAAEAGDHCLPTLQGPDGRGGIAYECSSCGYVTSMLTPPRGGAKMKNPAAPAVK